MATTSVTVKDTKKGYGGKPLQMISYNDKVKDDNAHGKQTMDYYLKQCTFNSFQPGASFKELTTKKALYDAYNNIIPSTLFDYVENPLKTAQDKFKRFPARIRPYNILRPNMDLLIGEWNKRPFYYDVVNADGDDAYNSFIAHKEKTFKDNVTQRYVNTVNELNQSEGEQPTQVPSEEIPDPKTLFSELNVSYKDAKALKGYRALKVLESELKIEEEYRKLFKDWLIAGEVNSLKLPIHGDIKYMRLSPLAVAADETHFSPYKEDGEFAAVKFRATPSEITDLLYDKMSAKQAKELEADSSLTKTTAFFNNYAYRTEGGITDLDNTNVELLDLYYCCWKSKKQIGFLTYPDPMTGQTQYDIVDESYKVDKEAGETIEWLWVNEGWHGWRVANNKYYGIEAIPAQRNEMNNFSACKLPINGKRFSDTESNNISILWLGMPYQIMYIIMMYRLELTIAKSKGKVVLMDKNVIDDEEDEEEFFWYSEAMGYALVDPKKGAAGFNQYQVMDLSLFQHIKELINIIDFIKREWDELVGITRQRKGQTAASDGKGVTEQAIFRSSVISELIFVGFEEFLQTELTGLLDISKYAWVDGKKGYYRNDDGRLEMLAIELDDYASNQYGVYVQNMSKYLDKLTTIRNQVNALSQRKDVKTSTIIDFSSSESITELKALVKKAEYQEQEIARITAENEATHQQDLEKIKKDYEAYNKMLEKDFMEAEWDRKDQNTLIQGEIDMRVAKDPSNIDPDLSGVVKAANDAFKLKNDQRKLDMEEKSDKQWQKIEEKKIKSQEKIAKDNNKTKLKNKTSGEK